MPVGGIEQGSDPRGAPISDYMDSAAQSRPDPIQQDPQKTTIKLVNTLLARAKKKRSRFDWRWSEYYDFFKGKQWPVERPKWRFSEAVNVCWSTIWSTTSIMTDSRPEIEFAPTEPSDLEWSQMLSDIQRRNWEKYNWGFTLTDGIVDSQIIDAAHFIVDWDPSLEDGIGDICFHDLDPYFCFPDPLATDIDDARYFIYNRPVPTSKLKTKYPKLADKISSDVVDVGAGLDRTQSNRADLFSDLQLGAYPINSTLTTTSRVDSGGEPMTMLIRIWLKDDTLEQVEQEGKNGAKLYTLKKKYPKGRYIEIASNTVLCDRENGVVINGQCVAYEDGKFPIVRLIDHSYPREYWGAGEIEQLKGPQKIVDYLWSFGLDHLKMSGNPQWLVGTGSGADIENITNEPGVMVEATDINQLRRESGEPLPGGWINMLQQSFTNVDEVSGIKDVSRGTVQPGITSGLMLEGYVEAAQTRIRLKNRNLDKSLQDIGQLMLSRMLQFYTAPRMTRITNKVGKTEFVEFFIQNAEDRKVFNFKKFEPGQNSTVIPPGQRAEIKGIPDVRVTTGSSLPFAKAQKAATAKELFKEGAIDQQELLKAVDWPNKEEVLARMAQAAAQAQQAQLAAGGPPK